MLYSNILSGQEIRRFAKQISLPDIGMEGQEKLKQAKVAVIGAGGIGTSVLQYLAASGVGNLCIIDHTLVDESNIQRQTLYGGNDLGKLKTIICKQTLQNLFPLIDFEIINLELNSLNINKIIKPFNVIVDATNDNTSHRTIDNACGILKLPWVYGSIANFEGQVAVFGLQNGAKYQNLLDSNKQNNEPKGISALAYGLLGNLMAFEVLKLLINSPESLHNNVLIINMFSNKLMVKSLI